MDDNKFKKAIRDIKKIYTPKALKRNLINASLILTAYELMKSFLIDQVKNFFEIDVGGKIEPSNKYKNEIKQLRNELPKEHRKYPLLVYSCWFRRHEVLTETDFENIKKIWKYRNKVTHGLIKFLVNSEFEVDVKYLFQIRDIVEKVEFWWVKEIEIPINPDLDQVEVKDADIRLGRTELLNHLISIAFELSPGMEEDKSDLVQ